MRLSSAAIASFAAATFLVAAPAAAQTAAPSLDDAAIVAIFDATNTADIETGTLAAEVAISPRSSASPRPRLPMAHRRRRTPPP